LPKSHSVQESVGNLHKQAVEEYQKAIKSFQEVRRSERFIPRWLRLAELLEGFCYDEMGEFAKAQNTYLRIAETFAGSSESAAAHFLWAEIERKFGRVESALRGYGRAFEILRDDPNYSCFWLPKAAILERCREMIRNNIRTQEYKEALTLLYLLRGVMSAPDLARFRGETYESWAVLLRQQAETTFGSAGEKLHRDSLIKYQRSGEAFAVLNQIDFESPDFAEWIWRSAENYRFGRDYRSAVSQYKNFLRISVNEHRPEVYLYLGELYIHIDALDNAVKVLEDAMLSYPNDTLIPRFRTMLSHAYIERKEWDKAKEILELNLIDEYSPNSAIYRDSMFALGKLFYESGHFPDAVPYLEDAVKNYPDAIHAADSHYFLAQIYLKQAADLTDSASESVLDGVRRQLLVNADIERENALIHIRKTEELLTKRREAIELTESEQLMLRNALFITGSILMDLKQYRQAISTLSLVATRYQNRPEVLESLIQLATAYRQIGQPENAEMILNQAEFVLNRLQKIGSIPQQNNWNAIIQNKRNEKPVTDGL
jgi:tetratricopeptide (TPR) repeat protein